MPEKENLSIAKPLDIVFYLMSNHGARVYDTDYPEKNPLGGSETAALRLAETLRSFGHNVRIMMDSENEQLPALKCDVFVSLRFWQVFHVGIYPGKVNYLWCQDDFNQQHLNDLRKAEIALPIYRRLTGVFMISAYQQVQWISNLNLLIEKIIPTTNGVPLEKFSVDRSALRQRQPWAYYSSTPFRGLDLLLQTWPAIRKAVPDARLHLFTSMKVYQREDSPEYESMYTAARGLEGVVYHGSVGQAELRQTALKCRALAYPCTFPETSCIAAMEAMAAGCAVVSNTAGALTETAWRNPLVVPGDNWLKVWADMLVKVLTDDDEYERLALQNLETVKYYDYAVIARQWIKRFREDLSRA